MKWLSNIINGQSNFDSIFPADRKDLRKIIIVSAYLDFPFFKKFQKRILGNFEPCIKPELEVFCDFGANHHWISHKHRQDYQQICECFKHDFSKESDIKFVSHSGLLHTKCILIESGKGKSIAIGSGNFTKNGFEINEELFMHFEEEFIGKKHMPLVAWLENIYFPALREIVVPHKIFYHERVESLRESLLAGKMVFEGKLQDSLRFPLQLPEEVKSIPTGISSLLEADLTDSVSLEKLVAIARPSTYLSDESRQKAKHSWKKLCIETCYGYWLAKEFQIDFDKILTEKEDTKEKYYEGLLTKIKEMKPQLEEIFKKECRTISCFIKKNHPSAEWVAYDEILVSTRQNFIHKKFSDWLDKTAEKLENRDFIRKISHGLVVSPTPDFWADPNACAEFLESIGNSIIFTLNRGGRHTNRPIRSILNKVEIDYDCEPNQVIKKMSSWIKKNPGKSLFSD